MELDELYDFELEKIIEKINKNKYKNICLQFPDGLKNISEKIVRTIELKTKANVFIWFGTNFGACDIPLGLSHFNIDLFVTFGHSIFMKKVDGW